ncbi:MAG: hypothetical protein LBT46_14170 [Planctomycetaceae bacterium]|jgi:hypothetical protein|nr:hypothetical protein [Planctomycetaceae bacterium]
MNNELLQTKIIEKERPLFHRKRTWLILLMPMLFLVPMLFFTWGYFDAPILRYFLRSLERTTGISVTFSEIQRSSHGLVFKNCRFQRKNHPVSNFDIEAKEINLNLRIIQYLIATDKRKALVINDLQGIYEQAGKAEKQTLSDLEFDLLALSNVKIRFTDRTIEKPFEADLFLSGLEIVPFRSSEPLLSILRSKGSGKFNESPLQFDFVENRAFGMTDIPVNLFASYVPLMDCFETGTVTFQMTNLSEENNIKLRLIIMLQQGCTVKEPEALRIAANRFGSESALRQLRKIDDTRLNDMLARWEIIKPFLDSHNPLVRLAIRKILQTIKEKYNLDIAELKSKLDNIQERVLTAVLNHFLRSGRMLEFDVRIIENELVFDLDKSFNEMLEKTYQEELGSYAAIIELLFNVIRNFQ